MKRELGIARCGLACCLCSKNDICAGCDFCSDKEWCENRNCSISKNLSHCYKCSELCEKGLLAQIKSHTFTLFAKRYGEEKLLDCLERNEKNGMAQDMLQALSGQARERQLEQQLLEHAEQGDAQAQYEVGRRFWNGDGVDQDHKQAADWFDRAARQGLAAAQCALGLCYERGDGVEQDMWQAAAWYQWAAQQDDVEAQLHLSECYEKGRGVPKDKEKAAEWLYKAAQHGGSYVKKWLKTLKK